ncbi:phosphoglycerate kinase [Candidatus Woesearchaeota archaeon]|nr:phosphoglycerate kinase [Candidatus Woesearchaeota archaeon]
MKLNNLKKAKLKNKYVLVRVDFNVPIKNNKVLDDSRIKAAIPTITYLIKNKAIIILMSHLGRPQGKVVDSLRMDMIAKHLSNLINKPVFKFDDCIGPEVEDFINTMIPGEVALLENLRFYKEETDNNYNFSQSLANFSDIYINEAFATCHRDHASITGVTKFIPSYAGFLVQEEVRQLSKLNYPRRPFVAIIAGAKIDKLDLVNELLPKVDYLIVGGVISNILLKAKGEKVGRLNVDKKSLVLAKMICDNPKIILPVDFVKDDGVIKDIGPKTIENIKHFVKKARTIFWAGPLGVFETKKFAKGTYEIAWSIARSKGFTVVGGGESASVVHALNETKNFSWVSTGGGAAISFIKNEELPGLKVLKKL